MDLKISVIALKDKLLYSAKLYPLASLFAFIFTTACIVLTNMDWPYASHNHIVWIDVSLASSFGFFMIVALYHWKKEIKVIGFGVLLSLIYFWSLPSAKEFVDVIMTTRHFVLIIMALLLLGVLPFMQQKNTNLRFWSWILNILLALISSIAFGIILYAGLAGAIKATSVLFEFEVSWKYYEYLSILIFGIFSAHYFLSLLVQKPIEIDTSGEFYNSIGNFFVRYILTSIASVYALILSGYVLKILFTFEWPSGVLVWLSLAFASLSLVTYLFWTPFSGRYRKMLIIAALIQLSMLFIAIYMRVSQYGWSSDRYMVTMLGIWFVLTFLYLVIVKKARYELPFALLVVLLFISQYGWKLNSYWISDLSQANRLTILLNKNVKLSNKSPLQVRCDISSSIDSIDSHHNKELLDKTIPNIVKKYNAKSKKPYMETYNSNDFATFATKELGFNYVNSWECQNKNTQKTDTSKTFFVTQNKEPLDISGYDTLYDNRYNIIKIKTDSKEKQNTIVIKENEQIIGEFDTTPFVKKLLKDSDDNITTQYLSTEQLTFVSENSKVAIKVYFESLTVDKDGQVKNSNAILLIKKKLNQ
ncbi:MAG: DUF4153 domain-containing protein [Sulfurovaceae bacterium]|nr:DUF4153 domain-containing protein [Sulfurovaceae bacterium]MDD5548207.1 DUF4153 domain-containing protein [Sulfurovaceae bacterium]